MQFVIEKKPLLSGLAKAVPISQEKASIPILNHVLLTAVAPALPPETGSLSISANNLSVGLDLSVPCDVQVDGALALPGRKLLEIVRELPDGDVSFALQDNGRVAITAGQVSATLSGIDAAEFPAFVDVSEAQFGAVDAIALSTALERVVFACSMSDARFNLNAVLFERVDAGVKLVTTDGHRLALATTSLPLSIPNGKAVIPRRNVTELQRVLNALDGQTELGFSDKNLVIRSGEGDSQLTATFRLADAEYPAYEKVLPEGTPSILSVNRAAFMHAAKRVSVMTSEKRVGAVIDIEENAIRLSAEHPDLGTITDTVPATWGGFGPESVIINVHYLLEALDAFTDEMVNIAIRDVGGPMILSVPGDDDYFNLLVPMRK